MKRDTYSSRRGQLARFLDMLNVTTSTVLVTSADGFIGSHLVEQLVKEGHSIFIIDNLSTGYLKNVPSESTFLEG